MRFHDISPELKERLTVRKAEVAMFAQLKDADKVANELRDIATGHPEYAVLQLASSVYFVVLLTPDLIEDKDVKNINP